MCALDLLYLAVGILLVSGAFYLSGLRSPARAEAVNADGSTPQQGS